MRVEQIFALAVFGCLVALLVWVALRSHLRKAASRLWPLTTASFQYGGISESAAGYQGVSTSYRLDVWFLYLVADKEYKGCYVENFRNRAEAERTLRSLNQGPLCVRYNPVKASDYFMDPYRDL
jgi:hypothetical protein